MLQDDFNKQFGLALKSENAEEFPVLKAFQSYIEAEREKARRKMLLMAAAFGGVVLLLVVVFGMILTMFVGKMFDQQNRAQDRMYSLMTQQQPVRDPRGEATPAVVTQVVVRAEAQVVPDVSRKTEVLAAFEPPAKPESVKPSRLPSESRPVAKIEAKPVPKPDPKPVLKPVPRPLAGVVPPPPPEGTVETVVQVEGRTAGTIEWRIYAPK